MTCCPCFCGFTLQVATKIIAILDMVISLFGGMTSGLLLFTLMFYREDLLIELYRDERLGRNYELRSFLKKPVGVQYSFLTFAILICFMELIVALILWNGSRKRNPTKCILWFRVHCVLFLLGVVFIGLAIFASRERIMIAIAGSCGLLYQAYTLWVVYAFVQEIHSRNIARQMHREAKRLQFIEEEDQAAEPLQDMRHVIENDSKEIP